MAAPPRHRIVVARYREDLAWLAPHAARVVLYNKGDDCPPLAARCAEYRELPNVGREAHAFLTYIVDNYDALPDAVTFTQGGVDGHPWMTPAVVRGMLADPPRPVPPFDVPWEPHFRLRHYRGEELGDAGCDLAAFWRRHLPDTPQPPRGVYRVHYGAFMVATRGQIRRRPRATYEALRATVSDHSAPEAAHMVERLWWELFDGEISPASVEAPR